MLVKFSLHVLPGDRNGTGNLSMALQKLSSRYIEPMIFFIFAVCLGD